MSDFVLGVLLFFLGMLIGWIWGGAFVLHDRAYKIDVGYAYLAPCIEQGYTEKHCFKLAMEELKTLPSSKSEGTQ